MFSPIGPVFLHSCAVYHRYIQEVAAGDLSLPPYQQTTSGDVIVHHGEVFCRMTNCEYRRVPLSTTSVLRSHIRKHGVMVARCPPGRISQGGQDVALAWFQALFAESEESYVDTE
ncbi:hypothetical protein N7519_000285 [Penicillium mononematosum]|uniref:uncharacterized protein n=1 Tax=Penicillium mononematosum TaxID=268346 RepID=UPI002546FE2B|nr:uncharacterized protein N7519_000285 [Penicillium mononematosum]KAJ6190264.1 hypothetical protein N7519_000285 [Penicillium mononematosum]